MALSFSADSVAVVGASSDSGKISGLPIKYLQQHDYGGQIYPVNPNHEEVGGLQCYPNVRDVPETPDFAMVILPSDLVLKAVEDCLNAGVKNVLIVSSGFSETGTDDGIQAEKRLATLAETHDSVIIGPNSQGIINFPERMTASFTPALERDELLAGDVSFVTQSGAFGGALTTLLQNEGVGLNKWIATGNEASTGALDVISQIGIDGDTNIVAGYIEGFKDGRTLLELKRSEEGIDLPIVLLKVGRSEKGRSAAASHTGKIASPAQVYESLFKEMGVIGVEDIDMFTGVVHALSTMDELPGKRIGVVTTSGGAGVHIADIAADVGLELPELECDTAERIKEHIPEYGTTLNPVDITGQVVNNPAAFSECLDIILEDENIDTVVLQITNASGELAAEFAERVTDIAARSNTPLVLSWTGGIDKEEAIRRYENAGIPVFENPARCVEVVAAITQFAASRSRLKDSINLPARPKLIPPKGGYNDAPPSVLTEADGKRLLSNYGIKTPKEIVVNSASEAVTAADDIGYPVVLKLLSEELQHKHRAGGVKLNIQDVLAVREAYEEFSSIAAELDIEIEGVAVQEHVQEGTELSTGIINDADFGPLVMLGRGGVEIEAIEDRTFRSIPTSRPQAKSMFEELESVREDDLSPGQIEGVISAVTGLSELYMENQWISEADVNPLILTQNDAVAVDALFIGPE